MSVIISWDLPAYLDNSREYHIKIYATSGQEDDEDGYSAAGDIDAKVGGTFRTSYEYPSGELSYFFYIKYYEYPSGPLLSRILCTVEDSIREQRLVRDIEEFLPNIIRNELVNLSRSSKNALVQAINSINGMQPLTSYSLRNAPTTWEPALVYGGLIFLFLNLYVGVSFKDFSYGDNGLSLNVDRGSKMNTAIGNLVREYDKLAKSIKLNATPDPIGLGSYALAIPLYRQLQFMYSVRSF